MTHHSLLLGVNVDHIATLRQARGTNYPDPMHAADIARKAGADQITVHLREDRRHIQDQDVFNIREHIALPLNLEMAATEEMVSIAKQVKPREAMLVPEKREELTTEGGLDVIGQKGLLEDVVGRLKESGATVSLFIDAEEAQIQAAKEVGAQVVEIHTGQYAEAAEDQVGFELERIQYAAKLASELGLVVNAGHGLHYQNVKPIAAIEEFECLNIGHSIVARASLTGFYEAVFTMKQIMNNARLVSEGEDLTDCS